MSNILETALYRIKDKWYLSDQDINISLAKELISIYTSLNGMFSNAKDQVEWLYTKHPHLGAIPITLIGTKKIYLLDAYLWGARR